MGTKWTYSREEGHTACGVPAHGVVVLAALFAAMAVVVLLSAGCSSPTSLLGTEGGPSSGEAVVQVISAEEAHDRMISDRVAVLDVRTQEEFGEGHICNAVLLPHDSITEETAQAAAPNKDAPVLVYCRTGRRSAEAATKLAELGYTQVYDFGGIQSWPYDVCSDSAADEMGTVENDELPVGVKVVCGKTRSLPEE